MFKIYAVSDSIGETAEQVARATASQFNVNIVVKRVPYIKTDQDVNEFLSSINDPDKSMVISNIILAEVRDFLVQRCIEKGIVINNVLSPCINMAAKFTGSTPIYEPGAVWNIDNEYYNKIEAMQFTMQYDDSKDISGIKNADVVIVGLSRTSKTALCMYLSNKGIRALNVPIMPEVPVPEELFTMDRKKIIGLTINPLDLIQIRKHRLLKFGASNININYANEQRILEEFDFADRIMKKIGCRVIDVTKRAIEDTALIVMESIGWVEKSF
ncbi:pyruvate, water dikinase regulatory protein [Haloimpatiens sp. FM7315]|uniref:pyruvate, water dikinase regulatory protein n=1 Tax=Haloimpatiens sp. FM7315 TaxID=3298609 RepID=UPI0035A31993